ncbi:glutamate ABC transporter substrate-binding protein [Pendulispora albinea]|uniref:Glutamate ABC transporter substrate-binding protein n=1 Tax=Pendulispora albinea TaxID=2741071 RepID=A0ABZ2LVB7_9BACT
MISCKFASLVGVAALAFVAALGGCSKNSSAPGGSGGAAADPLTGTGDKCASSGVKLTPATDVKIEGSKTFDKIKAAGKVVVGVKFDQPNLGYKDADGKRCGFDVEIAQLVASRLGIDPAKIEYKEIPSTNRETAIKGGEVDYYVGTYSISDKRKNDVGFAGPYFIAGQDLLLRKDEAAITSKETLKGKKVCSATGSTPLQRVRDQKLTEDENISEFKTYSECVSQLLDKKVDAVTTDDAILKGFAAQSPAKLKVLGQPFGQEKYGIGVNKEDTAFRNAINDILEAVAKDGTWKKIYDGTLGLSGSTATQPPVDRY